MWDAAVQKEYEAMKAAGVKINEVDKAAFRAAVQPMIDDFLKNADDKTRVLYAAFKAAK